MNYKSWATFFLYLFLEDEVVFEWFLKEMLQTRSQSPVQPKIARELADRHFRFLTEKTFAELDSAVRTVRRFGIQMPSGFSLEKANRDWYAELLWTGNETELEHQLEDNNYLLWVESCTHLPTYSRIRNAFGDKIGEIESIANKILESLGEIVPESVVTRKLESVLDDLEVTWPHLVNRVRANGVYIFRESDSAPTAKSVLVRLLVAKEQSLAVQLMLWPSPKLHREIVEWRDRAKLGREPVVHFVNSDPPIDNSPRGYVARSWKNRWRKDY